VGRWRGLVLVPAAFEPEQPRGRPTAAFEPEQPRGRPTAAEPEQALGPTALFEPAAAPGQAGRVIGEGAGVWGLGGARLSVLLPL